MKKWLLGLVILLIIGYAVIQVKPEPDNNENVPKENHQVEDENLDENLDETLKGDGIPVRITKDQVYKGNLLLINEVYPVPPGTNVSDAVNLAKNPELINGYGLLDNSIRLTPFLAQKLSVMIAAAHQDGINHFMLTSGYRDEAEQSKQYEENEPGYALPAGFSEHNLGLAVDIGSTQGKMESASEGLWLKENAWKYGFILRYPEDKTEITGIPYEPWHYRYVGLPHSAIMYENNFVLEEYLGFLKERKSIKTTINHEEYSIYYYSVLEDITIHVPADTRYEISGNNMDGVIVTVYSGQGDTPTNDKPENDSSTSDTPTNEGAPTGNRPNDKPQIDTPTSDTPADIDPALEKPEGAFQEDGMPEVKNPEVSIPKEGNG
jgi:D-alanyl-D-alanine carboxypeptidase